MPGGSVVGTAAQSPVPVGAIRGARLSGFKDVDDGLEEAMLLEDVVLDKPLSAAPARRFWPREAVVDALVPVDRNVVLEVRDVMLEVRDVVLILPDVLLEVRDVVLILPDEDRLDALEVRDDILLEVLEGRDDVLLEEVLLDVLGDVDDVRAVVRAFGVVVDDRGVVVLLRRDEVVVVLCEVVVEDLLDVVDVRDEVREELAAAAEAAWKLSSSFGEPAALHSPQTTLNSFTAWSAEICLPLAVADNVRWSNETEEVLK